MQASDIAEGVRLVTPTHGVVTVLGPNEDPAERFMRDNPPVDEWVVRDADRHRWVMTTEFIEDACSLADEEAV